MKKEEKALALTIANTRDLLVYYLGCGGGVASSRNRTTTDRAAFWRSAGEVQRDVPFVLRDVGRGARLGARRNRPCVDPGQGFVQDHHMVLEWDTGCTPKQTLH